MTTPHDQHANYANLQIDHPRVDDLINRIVALIREEGGARAICVTVAMRIDSPSVITLEIIMAPTPPKDTP
jgi:hypothetical protein